MGRLTRKITDSINDKLEVTCGVLEGYENTQCGDICKMFKNCLDCPIQKCFDKLSDYEDDDLSNKWIDANDKLPKPDTDVLIAVTSFSHPDVGFVGYDSKWYSTYIKDDDGNNLEFKNEYPVLYWMPLPEVPEDVYG